MPDTDALVEIVAKSLYGERAARGRDRTPSWDEMKPSYQDGYRMKARFALRGMLDAGYGIAPPGTWISSPTPPRAAVDLSDYRTP